MRLKAEFKTQWLEALRSGEYKHYPHRLRVYRPDKSGSDFSTLGVACDVFDPSRWIEPTGKYNYIWGYRSFSRRFRQSLAPTISSDTIIPSDVAEEIFEDQTHPLAGVNPRIPKDIIRNHARTELNSFLDTEVGPYLELSIGALESFGASYSEIADMIEEAF